MKELTRRSLIVGAGSAALPLNRLQAYAAEPRLVLNDASRLNPTPVARHWMAETQDGAFIERLRQELKEASTAKRPVAVGAARHSLGGQSLPRDGTAITLAPSRFYLLPEKGVYLVGAGTRWRDVIEALDPLGYSPAVMQSNNDFGVASTFSVNAHGWAVPHGPFGTTVRSIRIMLSDGTILNCSRTENAELFALALGGYGLFGIILDLEVEMVPNTLLKPTFSTFPAEDFPHRLLKATSDPLTSMAYGRVSVAEANFLHEAILVAFRREPAPDGTIPPAASGSEMALLMREIYRAQTGWDTGKRIRWFAETVVAPSLSSGTFTRNTLLNSPVSELAGRNRRFTDILHEYFVPPEKFAEFLSLCRKVIPRSGQDLLNITLRYVDQDDLSVLAYSPMKRIAAVMSFSQEMSPEAEAGMMRMTEELIDGVLEIGGSFYLPYRLHARRDQVRRAYPQYDAFIERKRHYDPGLLFRNLMWDAYFS
ncbi:FAD-binding oxidoreductase [Microvirga thermotolerans]|uniref:FAD-binding protein n=1 Tax=Microvirga thermotolerans TaxID=2651334 RepID=A0A5P9JXR8_9HYPH|nr:FAD-binding oxidoreductase [Microvirga thermotolerans]QFU16025.1 FAD-binding protein [Microvirga thermotolerans]